jgi:large subunit ribosomal protein L10
MPNAQKELIVSELREIVENSKGAILTDYRSLTVAEVSNLRKKLREIDAEYHIVKNTLFKIALGDKLPEQLIPYLTGPTAIVFAKNDIVSSAKTILDFVREVGRDVRKKEVQVKGGFIDGKVYNLEQVQALSKLPSKEMLLAQLIGTLNAPASELVGTLNGIISEFVLTLDAIAEKQTTELNGGAVAA